MSGNWCEWPCSRPGGQYPGWNGENIHSAFEIAGDGGQVDLDGDFGETSPSHSSEAIASLPCSEGLLDPAPDAMDRLIPLVEPCLSFLFGARPNASGYNAGNAALCPHGIAKVIAAIGAVGEHLAGIVGQSSRAALLSLILADVTKSSLTSAASAPIWALRP